MSDYRGVSLDHEEWPFTSPELTGVRAFFEHHPACHAIDYLGPCNCGEIKKLWLKYREEKRQMSDSEGKRNENI